MTSQRPRSPCLSLLDSDEFKENSFPVAFCHYLLWWDQNEFLPITALECPSALGLILESGRHPLVPSLNLPAIVAGNDGEREHLGFCGHARLLPTHLE